MAKANKEEVHLVSSEGTGYFYTFRRNRKKGRGEKKLSFMKYDPIARKRVKFEEKKISRLKRKYNPNKKVDAKKAEAKKADAK